MIDFTTNLERLHQDYRQLLATGAVRPHRPTARLLGDDFAFVLVVNGLYVKNLGNKTPPKKIPLTNDLAIAHRHNTKIKAMVKAENIMKIYGVYAECLQIQ